MFFADLLFGCLLSLAMLTRKVEMSTEHLETLGTLHDCKDIADIVSRQMKIMCNMFDFNERVESQYTLQLSL